MNVQELDYQQKAVLRAQLLAAALDPKPVAFYVQYKLVQVDDNLTAVSKGHQDDEETEMFADNLEGLVEDIEDRVTDGMNVFNYLGAGPKGYLEGHGPLKFVREVVLVFDLDQAEQAEVARLQAERTEDGADEGADDEFEDIDDEHDDRLD